MRPGQRIVQNDANAADREREDHAFNIKPRALHQVEETGRIPVPRNEDRLGQPEHSRREARTPHDCAQERVGQVQRDPREEKRARPNQPHVVIPHGYLSWQVSSGMIEEDGLPGMTSSPSIFEETGTPDSWSSCRRGTRRA